MGFRVGTATAVNELVLLPRLKVNGRSLIVFQGEQRLLTVGEMISPEARKRNQGRTPMQIQITLVPEQEVAFELAEVLRAFAKDYETWMIRSIKSGRHTLHDEAGDLVASLEIIKGAAREREQSRAQADA